MDSVPMCPMFTCTRRIAERSARGSLFHFRRRSRSAGTDCRSTSLKPLQDYVLVDLQSVPAESEGGILLPTVYYAFEEKNEEVFVDPGPRAGTVVAFGPGRRSNDGKAICPMPPLKVGQKIVVGRQMGEKVVLDGESNAEATHYLFRIDELVGYCE